MAVISTFSQTTLPAFFGSNQTNLCLNTQPELARLNRILLMISSQNNSLKSMILTDHFRNNVALGHVFYNVINKPNMASTPLETAIKQFVSLNQQAIQANNLTWRENRRQPLANSVANLLKTHLPLNSSSIKYLDIGSGDGNVTQAIANVLNISTNHISLLEVVQQQNTSYPITLFNGTTIPKNLLFKPNLITLMSVLHHMESLEHSKQLLQSAFDELEPGGLMVVRDFDACKDEDVLYNKVKHDLDILLSRTGPMPDDNNYYSYTHWEKTFKEIGFTRTHTVNTL